MPAELTDEVLAKWLELATAASQRRPPFDEPKEKDVEKLLFAVRCRPDILRDVFAAARRVRELETALRDALLNTGGQDGT